MAFDGTEGQAIDLETAGTWTASYRESYPNEIRAHFFGKEIINKILEQEGCMGIRVYNALDDDGAGKLILVGVDAEENDQTEGIVADFSKPCPSFCSKVNLLNGDSEL